MKEITPRVFLAAIAFSVATIATTPSFAGHDGFNADQKHRAMQVISVFENSTLDLAYDYVEALNDGRGYTVGLGLTTGTGDACQAVKIYTARVKVNPLAKYLPRLKELAEHASGSLKGLEGFPEAWKEAARDPRFRKVQEYVQDENSYEPALALWKKLGLKSALSLLLLYDTAWMHGVDQDPDGLPSLIHQTNAQASPGDEYNWMKTFLQVRRADLWNAHDPDTRKVWRESVHRADALTAILESRNFDLHGPIHVGYEWNMDVP